MLVFAAITPHPPLSIPSIGKGDAEKVQQTTEALDRLAKDLYAAQPDVIIIFSPHGNVLSDAFSINLHSSYTLNFEELGEFSTKKVFDDDPLLAMEIKEAVMYDLPLQFTSTEKLDYGSSIPLYHLTKELESVSLIPVNYSFLSPRTHFAFGVLLKDAIVNSKKRVAVIASADLAHTLAPKGGPAPFAPEGELFDKTVIQLLKTKNAEGMITIDPALRTKAQEDGLRSILMLLGVINEYNYSVDILSYEAPLGVGYLTASIILH